MFLSKLRKKTNVSMRKKSIILSVITLLELALLMVTITFSWFEAMTSLELVGENLNTWAGVKSKFLVGEGSDNYGATADLNEYFDNQANAKFSPVTSFDGENFYALYGGEASDYNSYLTGVRNGSLKFRKLTGEEKNSSFVYFSFQVTADSSDTSFWFKSMPTVKINGTALDNNENPFRIRIDDGTKQTSSTEGNLIITTKETWPNTGYSTTAQQDNMLAVKELNESNGGVLKSKTETLGNMAIERVFDSSKDSPNKNGEKVLFTVPKGQTKTITVAIWLEALDQSYSETLIPPGANVDLSIEFCSSWDVMDTMTVRDATAEQWLGDHTDKLMVVTNSENTTNNVPKYTLEYKDGAWTGQVPRGVQKAKIDLTEEKGKIYFTNNYGWKEVYAYCWNSETGNTNGSWPGAKMTWVAKNGDNQDIYTYTVPEGMDMLIFAEYEDEQTKNLNLNDYDQNAFYISGGDKGTLDVGQWSYNTAPTVSWVSDVARGNETTFTVFGSTSGLWYDGELEKIAVSEYNATNWITDKNGKLKVEITYDDVTILYSMTSDPVPDKFDKNTWYAYIPKSLNEVVIKRYEGDVHWHTWNATDRNGETVYRITGDNGQGEWGEYSIPPLPSGGTVINFMDATKSNMTCTFDYLQTDGKTYTYTLDMTLYTSSAYSSYQVTVPNDAAGNYIKTFTFTDGTNTWTSTRNASGHRFFYPVDSYQGFWATGSTIKTQTITFKHYDSSATNVTCSFAYPSSTYTYTLNMTKTSAGWTMQVPNVSSMNSVTFSDGDKHTSTATRASANPYYFAISKTTTVPKASDAFKRIYFTNNKSWGAVSFYCWTGTTGYVGWPGEAMTKVGKNGDSQDVYCYLMPNSHSDGFIFNNNGGGQQTQDLTSSSYKVDMMGFYLTGSNKYSVGTWTVDPDALN